MSEPNVKAMTAREHVTEALRLLERARSLGSNHWDQARLLADLATAHAAVATAMKATD
jgi:hypothetical protein